MEKFKKLFSLKTKDEAQNYSEKELVVSFGDLGELIINAESFGFQHTPRYFATVNPAATLTEKNYAELNDKTKAPVKTLIKLTNLFDAPDRKDVCAHFFDSESGSEWHCFFWVGKDIVGKEGGKHWGNIPHIHYTSFLYNLTRQQCEERIDKTGTEGISKAHVQLTK